MLEDGFLVSLEFVFRGHVSDCAVELDVVVIVDELGDEAFGVLK